MAEETKQKTVMVFSAEAQEETEHVLDVADNGEIMLTDETGHTLKLPAGTDADGLKAFLVSHKEANEGQITKASIEAKKQELLDSLEETPEKEV